MFNWFATGQSRSAVAEWRAAGAQKLAAQREESRRQFLEQQKREAAGRGTPVEKVRRARGSQASASIDHSHLAGIQDRNDESDGSLLWRQARDLMDEFGQLRDGEPGEFKRIAGKLRSIALAAFNMGDEPLMIRILRLAEQIEDHVEHLLERRYQEMIRKSDARRAADFAMG